MKKLSIVLIVAGLMLIIFGTVLYKQHQNADDSGGSASISTFNGTWSVKIPAYFGGVLLLFGSIFLYVAVDSEKSKAKEIR